MTSHRPSNSTSRTTNLTGNDAPLAQGRTSRRVGSPKPPPESVLTKILAPNSTDKSYEVCVKVKGPRQESQLLFVSETAGAKSITSARKDRMEARQFSNSQTISSDAYSPSGDLGCKKTHPREVPESLGPIERAARLTSGRGLYVSSENASNLHTQF